MTPIQLHDIALTLENDGGFYREYQHAPQNPLHRRNIIVRWWRQVRSPDSLKLPVSEREQLRRYFDDTIAGNSSDDDSDRYAHLITIEFWKDEVRFPETAKATTPTQPVQLTQPNEDIMTKAIEITTKTFANGADLSTMSDADVFNLIAAQEADIKELKKIEAQPKKLVNEIARREAGIAALVAHLDSKEAA